MSDSANIPAGADPMDQFERYDTVNTSAIVLVGFVSAILTFAIIIAVQAMFYSAERSELVKKDINAADEIVNEEITRQRQILTGYGWADDAKSRVSIPIDKAMAKVVQSEAEKKEASKSDGE